MKKTIFILGLALLVVSVNQLYAWTEPTNPPPGPPGNVAAPLRTATSPLSVSGVNLTLGNLPISIFNSGTSASATTFWRGDGTWASIAAGIGGSGTVNYIPRFTPNGTTLGNSTLTSDGSSTTANGNFFATNMLSASSHVQTGTGGVYLGSSGTEWIWPRASNSVAIGAGNVDRVTVQSNGNVLYSGIRQGPIGVYDPTNTQAVWTMGPAYILPVGGASTNYGGFYGLGWSYEPNYGGSGNNPQSKSGLAHQLLLMMNGTTRTALGSGIWTEGDITALGNITAAGQSVCRQNGVNCPAVGNISGSGSASALPIWTGGSTLGNSLLTDATTHYSLASRGLIVANDIRARNGYIYLGGTDKQAFDGTDSWLRLNQAGNFSSGVYTPGNLRVDGTLYLPNQWGGWTMSDSYWIRTTANNGIWLGSGNYGTDGCLTVGFGGGGCFAGQGRFSGDVIANGVLRGAYGAGSGMGVCVGNDACLHDVDVAGTMAIVSTSYAPEGRLQLGNGGDSTISGGAGGPMTLTSQGNLDLNPQTGMVTILGSQGLYSSVSYSFALNGETSSSNSTAIIGRAFGPNGTGVSANGTLFDFNAIGPGANYGTGSSIRWKKDVEPIKNALNKVMKIRGVNFDWIKEYGGGHDVGFIAEEVGKVLPEIVVYEENGVDAIGMDYSKITPLLLEAIKELKAENDDLRARLEKLEAKVK